MYYKVSRTWLTDRDGHSEQSTDRLPHMIAAESAEGGATAFVAENRGKLLGPVAEIMGDKATATAVDGKRVYVVFVERASESLTDPMMNARQREREFPSR